VFARPNTKRAHSLPKVRSFSIFLFKTPTVRPQIFRHTLKVNIITNIENILFYFSELYRTWLSQQNQG
jgi:hypothetical protein